jgi:hypothetical protein
MSIIIPSSVEILDMACFASCGCLAAVTFQPASKLVRIIDAAFLECYSLKSFIVPSSVEFIGESCFEACYSLSELIFASLTHLRELFSLPPVWRGSHGIPDSIEELAVWIDNANPFSTELHFGQESKLRRILTRSGSRTALGRSFL